MDSAAYDALLGEQAGVVSRAQLIGIGASRHDIPRLLRRRDLARIHRGVYVNHNGPLLWVQRAWAGVLFCWPAALSHESAVRAVEGVGRPADDRATIHVAVERNRHLAGPTGVRVHRVTEMNQGVQWNLSPPRVRYERALLDVAGRCPTELDALALLAQACQSRRTTAHRLLVNLDVRSNLPRRRWLGSILQDVADGTCSVLEHGFLHQVVIAHGLPMPGRQVRAVVGGRVTYRDSQWPEGLIVELDGRLFHDTTEQRDRDFDRDLSAASQGQRSVRLSYGQVFARSCATARMLVATLQTAGVDVDARPCSANCCIGG